MAESVSASAMTDDRLAREAAISAKIAAIRALNEERERRHAEVEADKKLAEKKKSAVDLRNAAGPEGSSYPMAGGSRDVGPPSPATTSNTAGRSDRRTPVTSRTSAQDRLRRDPPSTSGGSSIKSRIGDRHAPPPEPSYSFLSDRARDGSGESDEDQDPQRGPARRSNRGSDFGRRGHTTRGGARGGHGRGGGPRTWPDDPSYRNPSDRQSDSPPRSGRPPHPFGNGLDTTSGRHSQPTKFAPPAGFAQKDSDQISRPFTNPNNSNTNSSYDSSTGNQNRSTTNQRNLGSSPPKQSWKCPDPECSNINLSGTFVCRLCGIPYERGNRTSEAPDLGQHRRVKEGYQGLKIEVQFDKLAVAGGDGVDQDEDIDEPRQPQLRRPAEQPVVKTSMASGHDSLVSRPPVLPVAMHQQHQQPQQHMSMESANNWASAAAPMMTTMPVGQWTTSSDHGYVAPHPAHWSHQQEQHQPASTMVDQFVIGTWSQPAEQQQQPQQQHAPQWQPDAMQSWTGDAGIAWVQHQGYTTISGNHTMVHEPAPQPGAQYVHIPFNDPGMMLTPLVTSPEMMMPQAAPTHHTVTHHITQHSLPIMATQAYSQPPRAISNNSNSRFYNSSHNTSSSHRGGSYGGNGRGASSRPGSNANYSWRREDREVTKIPPRFQKQKMPVRQTQPRRPGFDSSLPRATSSTPPATARRLTIFANTNIMDNISEEDLTRDLGISVRLIAAADSHTLRQKLSMIDPALDRFVLVHGLCNEAGNIATTSKPDLEKCADSDEMAVEFSEMMTNLLERIPYLTVIISTLLPRFDREEESSMSCPNNVRKVMNVEISSRLCNNNNIVFINNDLVLEWWKDEVKKLRLFGSDGQQLTAYGFSVLIDHWMTTLKKEIAKADLSEDEDSKSSSNFTLDENAVTVTPKLSSVTLTEHQLDEKVSESSPKEVRTSPEVDVASKPEHQLTDVKADEDELLRPENVPLAESDDDDTDTKEEFHDAKADETDLSTAAPQLEKDVVDTEVTDEFREKNNDELMEKELPTSKED